MALRGNLRDFTVTQLLNLINLAHKTGTLVIEGPNETASISFRDGKLSYAQAGQEDNHLATILYRSNRLTTGQLRAIQLRASHVSDKELGLLLINSGYLTQNDILNALQAYCNEVVRRLFTWVEGLFRFDSDAMPPEDRITVRLDLENLIIEGARQLREWEQLQDEIPSLDMALKFIERPGTSMQKMNLSVEEWRVVSYINPRNTIQQIATTTKMSDIEIRRIVYGLLQAGLVEVIRHENSALTRDRTRPQMTIQNRDEQKSLVNRLITRIRSI
jgi:DNA-binding MarR family transcriptional regulator